MQENMGTICEQPASTSESTKQYNVNTHNNYGLLANAPQEVIETNNIKKERIPPIVVNDKIDDYKQFINRLNVNCKEKVSVRYKPSGPIIYATSMANYNNIVRKYRKSCINFHTYAISSKTPKMVVIRGRYYCRTK